MDARAIQLQIGGQSYSVRSSASEEELHRLAESVSATLEAVTPPGRTPNAQSLVLAALRLAHELEEERSRRRDVEQRAKAILRKVVGRLDGVLGR